MVCVGDFEYSHLTMGELNWACTSVHCMFVQFLPLTNVWIWQGLEFQGNPYQPTISLILKLFTFSFQKLSPCAHYTRFRLQLLLLWKAHSPFPGGKSVIFSLLLFFAPLDNNINIIVILTSKELQLWQWRVKWNWGEVAKVNSCAADGNQWVTNTKLGYPRTKKIQNNLAPKNGGQTFVTMVSMNNHNERSSNKTFLKESNFPNFGLRTCVSTFFFLPLLSLNFVFWNFPSSCWWTIDLDKKDDENIW